MDAQELFNLSPTLRLMAMGLLVAVGPLAWVWIKSRNAPPAQRLRTLTWVTLFLTFDLVIFGAFTRLTDSGLGCPDWPGCYGHASPIGAQLQIDSAQSAMPSGPVTHPKAWIEMIHRYLATGVGVLILTLALTSWAERRRAQISPWWPTFTLAWVCMQGAFGALTVTMKLFPAIVTLHLLGGMALLALLKVQSVRYAQSSAALTPAPAASGSSGVPKAVLIRAASGWLIAAYALLWLQIALGGWVSTNYAVMACTDFPACQNSMWPAMNFREGFTLWRELGAGLNGDNLSFQALTAIHYVHRLSAYVVFAALLVVAAKLRRHDAFRPSAQWLAGLAIFQMLTGLGNVWLGWPLAAAVLHTAGAAALVVVATGALAIHFKPARASAIASYRSNTLAA